MVNFLAYETIPLMAVTASSSVTFNQQASRNDNDGCMIINDGLQMAFISFGDGSATAQLPGNSGSINAIPIRAGERVYLTKGRVDTCAAITATGSTPLYFVSGKFIW